MLPGAVAGEKMRQLCGHRPPQVCSVDNFVDFAFASGIHPRREQLVLTLTLAVVVAVALKVIGAILIAAMLIIPAAAARPLVRSPEAMAAGAALIGVAAVLSGLAGSFRWDTPTGPTIVALAAGIFAGTTLIGSLWRARP